VKTYILICLTSLSATGCAGMGNVLAAAASGNGPICPNNQISQPTTVTCLGGQCAVTTNAPAHVAGCP